MDLNQGLDTKPANNPDVLSSPVDINKSLNTESTSEEVLTASQRETSAQQVQQVQQVP